MYNFNRAYSYQSFYGIPAPRSTICTAYCHMVRCIVVKHSLSTDKLYDMLLNFESLKSLGTGASFSLFELRNYLMREIRESHTTAMQLVFSDIKKLRKTATCCNGGCTACGAELPHWWSSANMHSREERKQWCKKTDGVFRIGFCSTECISKFDDAVRSSVSLDREDLTMTSSTRYVCENRYCKDPIQWDDLEYRGSRVFCSDSCEHDQLEEEYEDNRMYRKYDRY
jgi:hypothetical protein